MSFPSKTAKHVIAHPLAFIANVYAGFQCNQAMLIAGSIAYYALLSLVPLLILSILALSHFVEQSVLLSVTGQYLEWLVPSQSQAVLADVSDFFNRRTVLSLMLLGTMLFFSSLAFSVIDKAMAVIFSHRQQVSARQGWMAIILPYGFVFLLGVALFVLVIVSLLLQSLAQESIQFAGHVWPLAGLSGLLLYLMGLGGEITLLVLLFMLIPHGKTRFRHALVGALTISAVWEVIRHGLVWYFATMSKVSVVYGSLHVAVIMLFCMEIVAILLLLGAQVISEYEQLELQLSENVRPGSFQ